MIFVLCLILLPLSFALEASNLNLETSVNRKISTGDNNLTLIQYPDECRNKSLAPLVTYYDQILNYKPLTSIYLLYYGVNWQCNGSLHQYVPLINNFLYYAKTSPWFDIPSGYAKNLGKVDLSPDNILFLNYSARYGGTNLTDSGVEMIVIDLIKSETLPLDSNAIYVVYSDNSTTNDGFGVEYCGYHSYFTINNYNIPYAYVGVGGDRVHGACTWNRFPLIPDSPNNGFIDASLSALAHEITETQTDPFFNGWVTGSNSSDAEPMENGDLCAWVMGLVAYDEENDIIYNHQYGDYLYLIQQLYWQKNATSFGCSNIVIQLPKMQTPLLDPCLPVKNTIQTFIISLSPNQTDLNESEPATQAIKTSTVLLSVIGIIAFGVFIGLLIILSRIRNRRSKAYTDKEEEIETVDFQEITENFEDMDLPVTSAMWSSKYLEMKEELSKEEDFVMQKVTLKVKGAKNLVSNSVMIKRFTVDIGIKRMKRQLAYQNLFRTDPAFAHVIGYCIDEKFIAFRSYGLGNLTSYISSYKSSNWFYKPIVEIMSDVAAALYELHKKAFAHCGLRTSSIYLEQSKNGNIHGILSDFDHTRKLKNSNVAVFEISAKDFGTLRYSSPEILSSVLASYDDINTTGDAFAVSDVYSFGAVLYEAIFREPPWKEIQDIDNLLQNVKNGFKIPDTKFAHDEKGFTFLIEVMKTCVEFDSTNRITIHKAYRTLRDHLKNENKE